MLLLSITLATTCITYIGSNVLNGQLVRAALRGAISFGKKAFISRAERKLRNKAQRKITIHVRSN